MKEDLIYLKRWKNFFPTKKVKRSVSHVESYLHTWREVLLSDVNVHMYPGMYPGICSAVKRSFFIVKLSMDCTTVHHLIL
jgi:hypothetical protein